MTSTPGVITLILVLAVAVTSCTSLHETVRCQHVNECLQRGAALRTEGRSNEVVKGYYDRACQLGSAIGCQWAGELYAADNEIALAVERYTTACGLVHDPGCTALDRLCLANPTSTAPCVERGFHVRPCDDALSCRRKADVAKEEDTPSAQWRAMKLYERACELESYEGCRSLLALQADLELDETRSQESMTNRCLTGNFIACYALRNLAKHFGDAAQQATTRKLDRLCQQDDVMGCIGAGAIRFKEDRSATLAYLEKACDMEPTHFAAKACYRAARMITGQPIRKRPPLPVDPDKGLSLATKACKKDGKLCYLAGIYYRSGLVDGARNIEKAVHYFEKSCASRDSWSCLQVAVALVKDEKVQDKLRARSIVEELCSREYIDACTFLASMLWHGEGGPEDRQAAIALLSDWCPEDARACNNLAWWRCRVLNECTNEVEVMARAANNLEPNQKDYLDTLAYVLCRRQKLGEADAKYRASCMAGSKANCMRTCRDGTEYPPRSKDVE